MLLLPGDWQAWSDAERRAVVAHELRHFRHRHVLFGLLRSAAMLLAGFAAIGWLCRQPWLAAGFGFAHRDEAVALVAANLLLGVVEPVFGLVSNAISRRNEFQADDYARRQVGAAPMISALTGLSRDNAGTLTPDPLYALVTYGHPPVPLRVARLREASLADDGGRGGAGRGAEPASRARLHPDAGVVPV